MPTPASIPSLFIGLMSGTSLDGVDAALVDFGASRPQLLATAYLPYPPHLVPLLLALHAARSGELDCAATVANQLAQLYATTVTTLLQQSGYPASAIAAIGNHGQTIRHCPEAIDRSDYCLRKCVVGALLEADFGDGYGFVAGLQKKSVIGFAVIEKKLPEMDLRAKKISGRFGGVFCNDVIKSAGGFCITHGVHCVNACCDALLEVRVFLGRIRLCAQTPR